MKQAISGIGKWSLALLAAISLQLAVGPARADPISVFVGYADNLRPSGFFPNPWIGAPGVVSQSSAAQTFDSGAIRLDNTSASPITISNFTVTLANFGTVTIWSSLTIPGGGTGVGIFTQTAQFNFDSSDFGSFGALPPANLAPTVPGNNQIGGCSSPTSFMTPSQLSLCNANAPVVSFQENGGPLETFVDTGHILDTGQWDFINNSVFGEDGNESINWNAIGSTPNRGGTAPEPASLALLGTALISLTIIRRRRHS